MGTMQFDPPGTFYRFQHGQKQKPKIFCFESIQIACVYMLGLNFEPYFHLHAQNQQVLLPAKFASTPCNQNMAKII